MFNITIHNVATGEITDRHRRNAVNAFIHALTFGCAHGYWCDVVDGETGVLLLTVAGGGNVEYLDGDYKAAFVKAVQFTL